MTDNWFLQAVRFNLDIQVGAEVEVRWTNSYRFYRARAKVLKVNRASIVTELLEGAGNGPAGFVYQIGHRITVPRLSVVYHGRDRWSGNNGVFDISPAGEKEQS